MKASLSVVAEALSGRAGNAVFVHTQQGAVVRARPYVRQTGSTPAQQRARDNMAKAARAFRNLTAPQMQAWRAYAAAQNRTDKLTGRTYAPAANSIFAGLAAKLLQIDPQAELPTAPPSSPFRSDSIRVTAQPAAGGITFIPSAPNSEGILTELILQPLKSIHRTPNPRSYRTMAFTSFAEGQPVTIPTRLTPYAPAYRFVDSATGQSSGLIPLPVITGID